MIYENSYLVPKFEVDNYAKKDQYLLVVNPSSADDEIGEVDPIKQAIKETKKHLAE